MKDSNQATIGKIEEYVLLSVLILKDNAFSASIIDDIEEKVQKKVSVSSVYAALKRLEQNDYISSKKGESLPKRGGKCIRYFRIKAAGVKLLDSLDREHQTIWRGYYINERN